MTLCFRKFKITLVAVATGLLIGLLIQSCGSKYNKIHFEDPNKGNPEVYGEEGVKENEK